MPLPVSMSTASVFGTYLLADGTPQRGRVIFTPATRSTADASAHAILPDKVVVELDNTGSLEVDLAVGDDPDFSPEFVYWVEEKFHGNSGLPPRLVAVLTEHVAGGLDITKAPEAVPVDEYTTYVTKKSTDLQTIESDVSIEGSLTVNGYVVESPAGIDKFEVANGSVLGAGEQGLDNSGGRVRLVNDGADSAIQFVSTGDHTQTHWINGAAVGQWSDDGLVITGDLTVSGAFATPGSYALTGAGASDPMIAGKVAADSVDRVKIQVDGKIEWGGGSATRDVNLYRAAADSLATDDAFTAASFTVTGSATSSSVLVGKVTGDTENRLAVTADGKLSWGSGAATSDTNLYRSAADTLKTDDSFTARAFNTDSTVRSAFLKTTSTSEHAATIYQAATSGTGVALNVVSDNPDDSCVYITGTESGRGSLKIAHKSPGADSSASALSIDIQQNGQGSTAAQGIFITSTDGGTTGNLITVRHNSRDDFVVKSTGRVGVGLTTGSTPAGLLELKQNDTSTVGLAMTAIASGSQMILLKDSGGNARFEVNASGNAVLRATAFIAGGVSLQVNGTSAALGGGSGVISINDRNTAPTTNNTGGGILYSESGALKWRGASGTVTTIAPA